MLMVLVMPFIIFWPLVDYDDVDTQRLGDRESQIGLRERRNPMIRVFIVLAFPLCIFVCRG